MKQGTESRPLLCVPGGRVSSPRRCKGLEDCTGAGGFHQPEGGEANSDDGGLWGHALWWPTTDREAP